MRFTYGFLFGIMVGMVIMIILEVSMNPFIGWG